MHTDDPLNVNRDRARRELAAERMLIRHYRKALTCVVDAPLRNRWKRELRACRNRASRLAVVLAELGEPVHIWEDAPDAAPSLIDAMQMALQNGDMQAAETVARECMALAQVRCVRMRAATGHERPAAGRERRGGY